jgi:cysteinyl-tRNA synthetase
MNKAAFGETVDIHGGGRDLIFPHHENEIAQTEALTGKQFVKYWTHNGLIKVNGQKMSKSLGNSIVLTDLLNKYSEETIKFALLSTNYKNDINITDDLFPDAEKHLCDFYKTIKAVKDSGLTSSELTTQIDKEFDDAMSDDFNTALALSNLFGYFKKAKALINAGDAVGANMLSQIRKTYSLLGLFTKTLDKFLESEVKDSSSDIPSEVKAIADERFTARLNKDWAKSDELRAKLSSLGYEVKDSKEGYELIKK